VRVHTHILRHIQKDPKTDTDPNPDQHPDTGTDRQTHTYIDIRTHKYPRSRHTIRHRQIQT